MRRIQKPLFFRPRPVKEIARRLSKRASKERRKRRFERLCIDVREFQDDFCFMFGIVWHFGALLALFGICLALCWLPLEPNCNGVDHFLALSSLCECGYTREASCSPITTLTGKMRRFVEFGVVCMLYVRCGIKIL